MGRFAANFDIDSLRTADAKPSRLFAAAVREEGFEYDARRHLISRAGYGEPSFPFRYLGADDQAGPNYTGQLAVHGRYDIG
jgi:hypothetical protein